LFVSRFDPVPVEFFISFVAPRPLDDALGFRSSVDEAARWRLLRKPPGDWPVCVQL